MPETKLVIPLTAIKDGDRSAVGAKALGLARMSRIGLSVPAGFCVTAAAFHEHLKRNNLTPQLAADTAKLADADYQSRRDILADIRQTIIAAPMADELVEEIRSYYATLKARRVAVRSSATAEDLPGHSFAGLYDTYLGVTGFDDCIKAVQKCWASLWTERAYEYRQKNCIAHLEVKMAVIIQSLVPADASGIIFTADPLTGRTDRIIIEATFGFGDLLVSGRVTGDRFLINKKNLGILSRTVAEKKIESILDNHGLVIEQMVPAEQAYKSSIDDGTVRKLAKLAKKAEIQFGCPQDIEWAVHDSNIYLLQSRPVTTLPKQKSWQDRQIWANHFAQEVMPDVVTPVTWSFLQILLDDFFAPIFRTICMDRGDHPAFDRIAGRAYFNANIWLAVIRTLPGIRLYDFAKDVGGEQGLREIIEIEKTFTDDDLPPLKFNRLKFFLKLPLLLLGALAATPRKGQFIIDQMAARSQKWQALDLTRLSNAEIMQNLELIIADFRRSLGYILYLFNVLAALPAFGFICSKWFHDKPQCAGRLLAGLEDMSDAVAGRDLWRLAVKANSTHEVKSLIFSGDNWHTISSKLARTKSGTEFLASWQEFMDKHGFHCRGELELYNPRWSETPDYILALVRSYIRSIGQTDPLENHKKLTHDREQLAQQCRTDLRNPIKRALFKSLLIRSQRGSVFRENSKCECVKLIATLRKMLLELGKRFHADSVFQHPDDIFFLHFDEIEAVAGGLASFDVTATIAAQRKEYDKWNLVTPPAVIVGRFDPDTYVPEQVEANVDVLRGLGVSPGVATGKARVILRSDTQQQVLPGEILVAPFTDPGWTPYFVPAAGVVMDQGSILSHGSIVAREYGIPAVVNVGWATKIIKTGQTIQVDAKRGTVTILQSAGPPVK